MITTLMMKMWWRHAFILLLFASIAVCSSFTSSITGDTKNRHLGELSSSSLVSPTTLPQATSTVHQSLQEPQMLPRVDVPQMLPQSVLQKRQLQPPAAQDVTQPQLAISLPSSPEGSEKIAIRETIYGKVRGFVKETLPGKFSENYLGVPYAAPPIGELRLENPVSPKKWFDIRNCTTYPPACIQLGDDYVQLHRPNFTYFKEDCLYLNIYKPQTESDELLPVYAYIHGGSNVVGMAAMFDGDVFAVSTNVVIVMMNYRLSDLGFLSMASPLFAGNYGLWDQVFALKWIQKNIEYFGGDPAKVTLGGHSAGGADVSLHLISEHTRGLFRYAICHSGTSLSNWAVVPSKENPAEYGRTVADICNHPQLTHLKDCLKKQKVQHFMKNHDKLARPTYSPDHHGYLKDGPEVLLQSAPINAKVIMIGITNSEYTGETFAEADLNQFIIKAMLRELSQFPITPDIVMQEYIQWDRSDSLNEVSRKIAYFKLKGDYDVIYPSVQMTELLAERSFPVHLYVFAHRSTTDTEKVWTGVLHGTDMFYLFGAPLVGHPLKTYTELDKEVSKKYMALFGNFVKTGKAEVDSQRFFTYTPKGRHYIKVSNESSSAVLEQDRNLYPRRMEFWRRLVPAIKKELLRQRLRKTQYEEKLHFLRVLSSVFGVLGVLLICLTIFLLLRLRKRMTS